MAKFKCRLTGNIFEFVNDYDIADMREHPQYEEVEEEPVVEKKTSASLSTKDEATVRVFKNRTTVAQKKTKKEAK